MYRKFTGHAELLLGRAVVDLVTCSTGQNKIVLKGDHIYSADSYLLVNVKRSGDEVTPIPTRTLIGTPVNEFEDTSSDQSTESCIDTDQTNDLSTFTAPAGTPVILTMKSATVVRAKQHKLGEQEVQEKKGTSGMIIYINYL